MIAAIIILGFIAALLAACVYQIMKPWPMYSPPTAPGWVHKMLHDRIMADLKEMDSWTPWWKDPAVWDEEPADVI